MNADELKNSVCQMFEFGEDKWFDYEDEFKHLAELIKKLESEECAKICERMKSDAWAIEDVKRAHNTAASNCAAVIRLRSNVKLSGSRASSASPVPTPC